MTLRLAAALAVALHALPGLAQFEGSADFRMAGGAAGKKMEGTGRLYLSAKAWRMETEMKVPEGASPEMRNALGGRDAFRSVVFGKMSEPGKSWMLNERTKTYAVHELAPEERSLERSGEEWTITRAGRGTVAGVACENVRAQRKGEDDVVEACLARDFVSSAWMRGLERTRSEGWVRAAQRAGAGGFPVRMISREKDGTVRFRMEIVKVERRSLPATLFEVPAGYRETTAMGAMAQTPEQQRQLEEGQKRMEEAMKNMPPEQRKAIEEQLKRRQGRMP